MSQDLQTDTPTRNPPRSSRSNQGHRLAPNLRRKHLRLVSEPARRTPSGTVSSLWLFSCASPFFGARLWSRLRVRRGRGGGWEATQAKSSLPPACFLFNSPGRKRSMRRPVGRSTCTWVIPSLAILVHLSLFPSSFLPFAFSFSSSPSFRSLSPSLSHLSLLFSSLSPPPPPGAPQTRTQTSST